MPEKYKDSYLLSEVDRAILEVRTSMGNLAKKQNLAAPLMSISTLIDSIECHITTEQGESSFVLSEDGNRVAFRSDTLRNLMNEMHELATEIGSNEQGAVRIRQLAVNLFVVHELLHIRQNFPNFATVSKIKDGIEGIGLPLLDLAADTLAAWICAHIESERLGQESEDDLLAHYANCLMIAYVIGAFVYDGTSHGKRQRLLGLVISVMLVQAKMEKKLNVAEIYERWKPTSPVLAMNMGKAATFNALVIDTIPGLLLNDVYSADPDKIEKFWDHVGKRPINSVMQLAGQLLIEMGAISK